MGSNIILCSATFPRDFLTQNSRSHSHLPITQPSISRTDLGVLKDREALHEGRTNNVKLENPVKTGEAGPDSQRRAQHSTDATRANDTG